MMSLPWEVGPLSAPAMSDVRERPILFTGPMVRAILDGPKTQTRRVVKAPEPISDGFEWSFHETIDGRWDLGAVNPGTGEGHHHSYVRCPYGVPGDLLYVRETWRPWSWHEGEPIRVEYKAGGPRHDCDTAELDSEDWEQRQWIAISDELDAKGVPVDEDGIYRYTENPLRWRPSIYMPKCAARLWLRVTDVRVERVQGITEADARAEGASPVQCEPESIMFGTWKARHRFRDGFRDLWDSINKARSYGWDTNPWTWAVTFERTEAPR